MPDIQSKPWWTREGEADEPEAPHGEMIKRFGAILDDSAHRIKLDRFHRAVFHDQEYQGLPAIDDDMVRRARSNVERYAEKLTDNVIGKVISTLSAKFARQRPKPNLVTDGADWELQEEARQQDQILWAEFQRCRAYEHQRLSDLHLMITGTGAIQVCQNDGGFNLEVSPSWELFVDPWEGRYGETRTLYRFRRMQTDVLIRDFKEHKEAIENSLLKFSQLGEDSPDRFNRDTTAVVEAWRIGPSGDDGRHVIAVENCTLLNEVWDHPRFPHAFCRWQIPPEGFWGIGLVQAMLAQQLELNQTLSWRQQAIRMLAAPFVLVERGSKVIKTHLNNRIGHIVEYTGMKPEIVVPEPLSESVLQHGDRVKQSMFQGNGVSELSVSAMKPAGLNSGRALRAYADMSDDSIHDVLLRREQQIMDLAECVLDAIEDIDGYRPEPYMGEEGLVKLDNLPEIRRANVKIKVLPSSSLSVDLAGKLEDIADLQALGVVTDPNEMRELLSMPDLKAADSLALAPIRRFRQIITQDVLRDGKDVQPEPFWDFETLLRLAVPMLMQAESRKAKNCDKLRAFILRVTQLREGLPVIPPEQAQEAGIDPSGAPMPPTAASPIGTGEVPAAGING